MYLAHFGFRQVPFGITPDTEFLYPSRSHSEGLNLLHVALASGEGFIKVVGEIGTGKTLLCRNLLAELDASWQAAYLPNPQLEPHALLDEVADELGIDAPAAAASGATESLPALKRINRRLLELAGDGRNVVLCIDEAQTMPRQTLESLRLLSNLETEKRKLLHIVLFGQPELDAMLSAYSARQLRQRIVFHYRLQPLTVDEVRHYLEQRLRTAGHCGGGLFDAATVKALARAAGGTPRLINILAHKALLAAYGEGAAQVAMAHLRAAIRDTDGAAGWGRRWSWWRR